MTIVLTEVTRSFVQPQSKRELASISFRQRSQLTGYLVVLSIEQAADVAALNLSATLSISCHLTQTGCGPSRFPACSHFHFALARTQN